MSNQIAPPRPAGPGPAEIVANQLGILLLAGATAGRSIAIAGPARATQLAALGLGTGMAGELLAVGLLKSVEHRLPGRLAGVPLGLIPAWYVAAATGYDLALAALPPRAPAWAIAGAAATAATAADLAIDPMGLARGYWVWPREGHHARGVVAANGLRGVPWANYLAWLVLVGGVAFWQRRLAGVRAPCESARARRWARLAVLSYLFSVAPALIWAARNRHWDAFIPAFLGVTAAAAAALWRPLTGARPAA